MSIAIKSLLHQYNSNTGQWEPITEHDIGTFTNIVRYPQKLADDQAADPDTKLKILFVGDSMIGTKRYYLDDVIEDRFGEKYGAFSLDALARFGGNEVVDPSYWPTAPGSGSTSGNCRALTSTSGDVKFNSNTVDGIECDRITVFYAYENNAGSFKIKDW